MLSKRTLPATPKRASCIAAITRDVLQRFDEHACQRDVHMTGHFAFVPASETPDELQEGELGYTCVVEYPSVPGMAQGQKGNEQAHPQAIQRAASESQVSMCVITDNTAEACSVSRRDVGS